MPSTLRSETARLNGAKSHGPITPEGKAASAANSAHAAGPVTPEGKARVSQNALRHGMLASTIVLAGESEDRFASYLALLHAELRPEPGVETDLVEVMAVAHWRRMRAWCLERVQLAAEALKQQLAAPDENAAVVTGRAYRTLTDESRSLHLLNRYEISCSREYQRSLATF